MYLRIYVQFIWIYIHFTYLYTIDIDILPASVTQVLKSFFEKEGHTTVPKKFAALPGSPIYIHVYMY